MKNNSLQNIDAVTQAVKVATNSLPTRSSIETALARQAQIVVLVESMYGPTLRNHVEETQRMLDKLHGPTGR